jgi:hypothetical protein
MSLPAQRGEAREAAEAGGFRADLPWLAVVLLVAVALRGWQLTHTEVASRDSIGYIRIAWQLEHGPWGEVLRNASQHPGYPVALLGVSHAVRRVANRDLAYLMQISAQLTSAAASVLLVFPTFYLGRELFGRRVAFWTALLFQCLPASGRGMADGLSEPMFLVGATAALAFACHALRRGSPVSFALCGACSALAYLTRPEGLLIAGLTAVVLVAGQLVAGWRQPWRRVVVGGASLTLAALAIGGPYAWTIGNWTVKPTALKVGDSFGLKPADGSSSHAEHRGAGAGPLLAVWWQDGDGVAPSQRTWWGVMSLLEVLSKGFFYFYWAPALVGLWWFRDRFRLVSGTWVLALLCAILAFLLYRVAQVMGYLSDRHTLLIVLAGSYFAVAALDRLARTAAGWLARWVPALAGTAWADGRRWSLLLLLAAVLSPLPRTLERLHADRTGFRAAGYWLAQHALPGDFVLDPYCWAHFYAGRVFTEDVQGLPRHEPLVEYLVVEVSDNKHTRLKEHQSAVVLARYGKEVHRWNVRRGKDRAAIIVYELPFPVPVGAVHRG